MANLTKPYPSSQFGGVSGPIPEKISLGVADGVLIYQGALVQINVATGFATPAGTTTTADTHTFLTIGRSIDTYDNTVVGHTAGGITGEFAFGAFLWQIGTAGDALLASDIGIQVYAIDDNTVGKTSNSNVRAVAGRLIGIDTPTNRAIVLTLLGLA